MYSSIIFTTLLHYSELRSRVLRLVQGLLVSHDDDPRYYSPECRTRIAQLYFPIISLVRCVVIYEDPVITCFQLLDAEMTNPEPLADVSLNSSAKRDAGLDREVLLLVLHVINNVDPEIFHHWWSHIVSKDVEGVMRVFGFAVEAFEYKSTKRRLARNATIVSQSAPQTPSANPELAAIAQRYQGILIKSTIILVDTLFQAAALV